MAATPTKPHNMDEIMTAIQKVLADHDVSQARVVLELFDEADQHMLQQQQKEQQSIPPISGRQSQPRPMTVGATATNTVQLPVSLEGDGPMQSPERQAPPPRPQSSSDHCTHMVGGGSNATSPRRTPLPPGPRLGPLATAVHQSAMEAVPNPLDGPVALDCTVPDLDHTARPEKNAHAVPTATATTTTPRPPQQQQQQQQKEEARAVEAGGASQRSDETMLDPSALLPQDLFQELNQQRDRAERLRILKSFVGKSVLLDDKKVRESQKQQKGGPGVSTFLTQYKASDTTSPKRLGASPTSAGGSGTLPSLVATTRIASGPAPSPQKGSTNKDLPTLPNATGTTAAAAARQTPLAEEPPHTLINKGTFITTCRDNAQRTAQLNTGLTNSYSPTKHSSLSPNALAGASLKDMLREQQRMEKESQSKLREHAQVMDKARKFLQEVEGNDAVRPHLELLRAEKAVDGAASLRPSPVTSTVTTKKTSTLANGKPGTNNTNSTGAIKSTVERNEMIERELIKGASAAPARRGYTTTTATTTTRCSSSNTTMPVQQTLRTTTTTTTNTSTRDSDGPVSKTPVPPPARSLRPTPPAQPTPSTANPHTVTATAATSQKDCSAATPPPPAAAGPHTSGTTSPRRRVSGSIQVVRFTMPTEKSAKEAVMAQLSRSPAGQHHLGSKDKYAAMLAGQNNLISENEGKNRQYQELVERAVEFNESLRGGVKK